MYKNILIAVDLAGSSSAVLKRGKQLAEQCGAKYHAVYCINHPVTPFGELSVPGPMLNLIQLKHEIFAHFKQLVEKVDMDSNCISIEIGHSVDTIIKKAKDNEADLIIVGTHGKHGVRLLVGSTVTGILHHAHCDVLTVRIKEPPVQE